VACSLTDAISDLLLDEMEEKYDAQFKVVFDAIRALMEPPKIPHRRVGY